MIIYRTSTFGQDVPGRYNLQCLTSNQKLSSMQKNKSNMTHNKGKKNGIKTNLEITQMIKFVDKNIRIAITAYFICSNS